MFCICVVLLQCYSVLCLLLQVLGAAGDIGVIISHLICDIGAIISHLICDV